MVITGNTCKVWSRLERKKKDGSTVKIRFQELPPDRLKEAIDLNIKYILRDEVIHRATGVYKNAEATREYRTIINKMFEVNPPHVTICCVDDGSENGGELTGMSKIALIEKSSNFPDFLKMFEINTKELEKLIKAAIVLKEPEELTQQFPRHFYGKGIIIHPDYRGLGIATEFIRIRSQGTQKFNSTTHNRVMKCNLNDQLITQLH